MATAGVTLYTVESVKDVDLPDGTVRFVAVDGGMSDNLRPMLYDAPYEADLARPRRRRRAHPARWWASTASPATC